MALFWLINGSGDCKIKSILNCDVTLLKHYAHTFVHQKIKNVVYGVYFKEKFYSFI